MPCSDRPLMRRAPVTLLLYAVAAFFGSPGVGTAHEFWIMPERFVTEPTAPLRVDLMLGDHFAGDAVAYHPRRFHRFDWAMPGGTVTAVKNRPDSLPAVELDGLPEGLNVLVYQSRLELVTYPGMAKFESFLEGKRLDWAIDEHKARDLPRQDIREAYFRYAKALVQSGTSASGADRTFGMPMELVALDNPYLAGENSGTAKNLRVRLLLKGEPHAGQPVLVFARTDEGIEKSWYKTDVRGETAIPLTPDAHILINAVHIQPAHERMRRVFGAVWQTLWASMTLGTSE